LTNVKGAAGTDRAVGRSAFTAPRSPDNVRSFFMHPVRHGNPPPLFRTRPEETEP
jgi:hypothetical protein